ncbi:MAG: WG repeat-containing protein [Dyadobacter fermentans]
MNLHGEKILETHYAGEFHEGLVKISENDYNEPFGFMNKKGEVVVPLKYQGASDFSEGLALVALNDKWGYINPEGKEVIPLQYSRATDFKKGLAVVCKKNGFEELCGVVDKTGKEVVSIKYQEVGELNSAIFELTGDVFPAKIGDKGGLANTKGEAVRLLSTMS